MVKHARDYEEDENLEEVVKPFTTCWHPTQMYSFIPVLYYPTGLRLPSWKQMILHNLRLEGKIIILRGNMDGAQHVIKDVHVTATTLENSHLEEYEMSPGIRKVKAIEVAIEVCVGDEMFTYKADHYFVNRNYQDATRPPTPDSINEVCFLYTDDFNREDFNTRELGVEDWVKSLYYVNWSDQQKKEYMSKLADLEILVKRGLSEWLREKIKSFCYKPPMGYSIKLLETEDMTNVTTDSDYEAVAVTYLLTRE